MVRLENLIAGAFPGAIRPGEYWELLERCLCCVIWRDASDYGMASVLV